MNQSRFERSHTPEVARNIHTSRAAQDAIEAGQPAPTTPCDPTGEWPHLSLHRKQPPADVSPHSDGSQPTTDKASAKSPPGADVVIDPLNAAAVTKPLALAKSIIGQIREGLTSMETIDDAVVLKEKADFVCILARKANLGLDI